MVDFIERLLTLLLIWRKVEKLKMMSAWFFVDYVKMVDILFWF